jgi:hypothetical protein
MREAQGEEEMNHYQALVDTFRKMGLEEHDLGRVIRSCLFVSDTWAKSRREEVSHEVSQEVSQ